jgi:hypothetical protein
MWASKNAYKILIGKPEGRGPLRRYKHQLNDNAISKEA